MPVTKKASSKSKAGRVVEKTSAKPAKNTPSSDKKSKKPNATALLHAGDGSDNESVGENSAADEKADSETEEPQTPKKQLDDSDEDDFASDSDEEAVFHTTKKTAGRRFDAPEESEDESSGDEEEDKISNSTKTTETAPAPAPSGKLDETSQMVQEQEKRSTKLKRLTPDQLAKEQKKIKRTGVCYLSSIPPYMKPVKLRSVLSKYGKLDRIFLKPEDPASYHRRVKYGGNKKKRFTEGWVEFVKKSDAKLCAESMNGNILGGKKSSYYHDDIINIKYLSGFKWFDLTQQISKENEVRQAKFSLEISQQAKLDKSFVNNVERSKHYERKRKAQGDDFEERGAKRDFSQNTLASTRADARQEYKKEKNSDNLESVLSKVF